MTDASQIERMCSRGVKRKRGRGEVLERYAISHDKMRECW